MEVVDLVQGSPEWHEFRAVHRPASETPIVIGVSPHMSRLEMLKMRAAGIPTSAAPSSEMLFARGHRAEELARPIAEKIIGEELYRVTGKSGLYSASFDGLTMLHDIHFEHKLMNRELAACSKQADLPIHIRAQIEHQFMVCDSERCLFMASDYDANGAPTCEPVVIWCEPDMELRSHIIAAWEQFDSDVRDYVHVEEAPAATGTAPAALPAVVVTASGGVSASNLAEFRSRAAELIEAISEELETDEDFATAEKSVKWCHGVEDRLELTKQQIIEQLSGVAEAFGIIDSISDMARDKRLRLDRLVKARKDAIRARLVADAHAKYVEYAGGAEVTGIDRPDFAGAIKGLKTLKSIHAAIDAEMARAKIAIADKKLAPVHKSNGHAQKISLAQLNERIAFSVSAEFLESLGIEVQRSGRKCYDSESDFLGICTAISDHLLKIADRH